MFRRAMKRAVQNAMRLALKGIKVEVSGRLAARKSVRTDGTAKVAYRCTLCVQTSIITPLKLRLLMVLSVLKCGSSKADPGWYGCC